MDLEVVPKRKISLNSANSLSGTATHSHFENNLVFICELQPATGSLQTGGPENFSGNHKSVTVTLPAQCSIYQLRLRICMKAQQQNSHLDPLAILDPEKYSLLYARGEDWYEAYDNCQIVRTLDVPWSREDSQCLTANIVVKPQVATDPEEKIRQQQWLTYLIGHDLEREASDRLGELTFTRRKLASPRRQELKTRDDTSYTTEPWVTSAPVPNELEDWLERKFSITLHYLKRISFSVQVDFDATPKVLLKVFRRVTADNGVEYDASEDLVLKVTGREEFFSGDCALMEFLWVRHCLETNQDLHLSVLPVSHLVAETVKFVDWPLVDGFSGQFSSHDDLSFKGKDLDDIFMISLWDCNRWLRVKLLGFDIPKLPNKHPQSIYVEASILYGSKVLSTVSSVPKLFADEVLWNEWLDFDVLLRDLPRGVKLGFTINASAGDVSPTTKDTKPATNRDSKASTIRDSKPPTLSASRPAEAQKGKGKVLYFVNLLLIDHRSVLSQGPYTLHMWPYPDQDDEAITYQADKLSSATNPDRSESMAISFLLDRYSFPVVLPNTLSQNDGASSSTSSLFQDKSTPPMYAPSTSTPVTSSTDSAHQQEESQGSDTDTVALRSTSSVLSKKRACLKRFREESIQYASNLPQFLRSINWMDRRVVEDVHWLLGNWDPGELDVTVALELLSMDFTDEMVRRLAVQKLESLSNDDVLKYLLQLVQTLKVEPYHDSFLARYLIQRTLRSKRIGHFFFWYVRSEVAGCPYFRQRMAVILEAYLLGCGQAMIDDFTRQVQAVEALQEVAVITKRLYPDKTDLPSTAPHKLQELLRNSNLPNEFLLPFDPRVRVGTILLDKCKVMASKKKPLWLEFSPMPSPTSSAPVGIIFKEGDDLRQDMLVIQTLAVMNSIWQEKSLDLNLIPYGCISTGQNIGMIEIVRNAATIAAVQKSHGGTTAAFRNDALFEWLKSKCPLQEIHYKTVERFVKSCAGYCVATYVLGIGDRHNDNIMITDQGNLFHIDFGHILGNRKSFLGVNRERAPFVLTPDFLYVMGRVKGRNSLNFQRFRDTCSEAYLLLRSHSRLLVTLFSLMLLTGIPELSAAEDMRYLREALQEEQNEAEAKEHFLQQISACEQLGWTVQANWWIHMVAGIK
ncbi:phosphatidylinositol 4,5-bisphosphate 3-kinase catalytic subunit gamma isoform [Nothobranchius furzeri]|uniref:phosphatidylinositol 3-kinase n=3 Tax=Nothobranchius furzeri TaxID=105023 RepID=A0A9D2XYR8_NOTFU|nr:5-bisphosphate 3-kinase catalytic subunit gamma isoform-like [Nothobranchius furzeri]